MLPSSQNITHFYTYRAGILHVFRKSGVHTFSVNLLVYRTCMAQAVISKLLAFSIGDSCPYLSPPKLGTPSTNSENQRYVEKRRCFPLDLVLSFLDISTQIKVSLIVQDIRYHYSSQLAITPTNNQKIQFVHYIKHFRLNKTLYTSSRKPSTFCLNSSS